MAETQKAGRLNDAKMDEWEQDLHPNPTAGQNHGLETAEAEKTAPTAYDLKELHEHLEEFAKSDLKQITILTSGTRLQQGATYVDLMDLNREAFTAMGNMEVEPGHYYVPKTGVDYRIWNRLTRQV